MKSILGIGTAVFVALGFVVGAILLAVYGKEYRNMTRRESINLILVCTITATFCLWLFPPYKSPFRVSWACVYMHQMVPLIDPEHTDND